MTEKTAMQATAHDTTLLAEASRLWTETGTPASEIARLLGITTPRLTQLRRANPSEFGPREFVRGDPPPEEIERRKLEVMEMRRAAGLRCPEDDPTEHCGPRVGAIRVYHLADKRSMTFRQAGL